MSVGFVFCARCDGPMRVCNNCADRKVYALRCVNGCKPRYTAFMAEYCPLCRAQHSIASRAVEALRQVRRPMSVAELAAALNLTTERENGTLRMGLVRYMKLGVLQRTQHRVYRAVA